MKFVARFFCVLGMTGLCIIFVELAKWCFHHLTPAALGGVFILGLAVFGGLVNQLD